MTGPAARAWIGTVATSTANLAIGVVTGILAARLLLPEGRGVLAEVLFWSGMVASLGRCGLPIALTYQLARGQHASTALSDAAVVAIALGILSFIASLPFLILIVDPALQTDTIVYTALFVPFNFLSLTLIAGYQGRMQFRSYNLARLVPQATYLLGILLLWMLGFVYVSTFLIATWAGTLLLVVVCIGSVGRQLFVLPNWASCRALMRLGWQSHMATLLATFSQQADRLVVIALLDHAALGLYAVAYTLSSAALGIVASAADIVAFPKLAAASDPVQRSRQMHLALGGVILLALAVNGTIILLTPVLLPFLFGPAFAPAVPVAILLALAQLPACLAQVGVNMLRALGDWRAGVLVQIVALVTFLPALAASLALLGPCLEAAALPMIIGQLAAAALTVQRLRAVEGLRIRTLLSAPVAALIPIRHTPPLGPASAASAKP